MANKSNIHPGKFETDDNEFSPRNVKVRITAMIDLDVLDFLKATAEKKNTRYQTLLNQVLRRFMESDDTSSHYRPRLSDSEMQKIAEKMSALIEKKMIRKKKA